LASVGIPCEVADRLLQLYTVVLNIPSVVTWTWYESAPATLPHESVGVTERLAEPLVGEASTVVAMIVEKLHAPDHSATLPGPIAATIQ